MSEFHWVPDFGCREDSTLRTNEAKFGDGYSQSVLDGINALDQSLSLSFKRESAECEAIKAFLLGRKGQSFTFTPPGQDEIRVKCVKFSKDWDSPGWEVITATFERSYS